MTNNNLKVEEVSVSEIKICEYNPRAHTKEDVEQLKESINEFGVCDPLILNSAPERKNVLVGGNFRFEILKDMGYKDVPVVYINIPDIEKEKELNIRLNKNTGSWDWNLLAGKEGLEPLPSKQCKDSLGVLKIVNLRCQGLGKMRQMRQYKKELSRVLFSILFKFI